MKRFLMMAAVLVVTTQAHALTVKEQDIAQKTNLVTTGVVDLNGSQAKILIDSAGFSLYTFQADTKDQSNCSGGCLTVWPPLHVPDGEAPLAPFGVIKGNDGQNQLTLQGLPLYHYVQDKNPGDAFGQYPQWDAILIEN